MFSTSTLALSGCALLPQFGEPPATNPTAAAPDTMRTQVPDPDLWPTATDTPTEPVKVTEKTPTKPKVKTTPPATTPEQPRTDVSAASDSVAVVAPAVTVSPTRPKLEEFETETIASLNEAKRLIAAVDPSRLDAAGQDKLRIVRGFITQAEDAMAKQDLDAASGLARKARLLAIELASH
ncbi:MAG: hypothetical protein R3E97_01340 [Candidatus Eisenbacteria bacterium]